MVKELRYPVQSLDSQLVNSKKRAVLEDSVEPPCARDAMHRYKRSDKFLDQPSSNQSERSKSQPVVVHKVHVRIHPSLKVFGERHIGQRLIETRRLLHVTHQKHLTWIS